MLPLHRLAPLRLVRTPFSTSKCSILVFARHLTGPGRASAVSQSRNTRNVPRTWKRSLLVAGVVGTSYLAYSSVSNNANSEDTEEVEAESSRPKAPLASLIRTYVVYSMCSIPMLVDYSPSILSVFMAMPGIRQLTESFVRWTFFAQFVGAETAAGLMPILTQLRKEGKGALVSYSVEVNAAEAAGKKSSRPESSPHEQLIAEYIRSVDVAADFEDQLSDGGLGGKGMGRRTWVPLKLTALVPDSETLRRFSIHLLKTRPPSQINVFFPAVPRPSDFDIIDQDGFDPIDLPESSPLTAEDVIALQKLKADLFRVCERAKERNVRILIDAEYSWYQPAIDAFQLALMREFNQLPSPSSRRSSWSRLVSGKSEAEALQGGSTQPLVYGTFQAYLRRTPKYLQQSLIDAQAGNYALGVKLVRGAYHIFEQTAHAQRVGQLTRSDRKVTSSPSIQPLEESEAGAGEYKGKPPVWDVKEETDRCYDECAGVLLGWVAEDVARKEERARVGAIFGTHNAESVRKILDSLVQKGLATSTSRNHSQKDSVVSIPDATGERVTFGQLYGMRDALTEYIISHTESTHPCVVKCLPYGPLSEVLPYLVRRAMENKSMLNQGSAAEERRRVGREIARRARSAVGF